MSETISWRSLGLATPSSLPIWGKAGSMASIDKAVKDIIIDMMMINSTNDGDALRSAGISLISSLISNCACVMSIPGRSPMRPTGHMGWLEN